MLGNFVAIFVIVSIILLNEGVLACFWGLSTIFPFMTRLVSKFLLEVCNRSFEGAGSDCFDLTNLTEATPTRMRVVAFAGFYNLKTVELGFDVSGASEPTTAAFVLCCYCSLCLFETMTHHR